MVDFLDWHEVDLIFMMVNVTFLKSYQVQNFWFGKLMVIVGLKRFDKEAWSCDWYKTRNAWFISFSHTNQHCNWFVFIGTIIWRFNSRVKTYQFKVDFCFVFCFCFNLENLSLWYLKYLKHKNWYFLWLTWKSLLDVYGKCCFSKIRCQVSHFFTLSP